VSSLLVKLNDLVAVLLSMVSFPVHRLISPQGYTPPGLDGHQDISQAQAFALSDNTARSDNTGLSDNTGPRVQAGLQVDSGFVQCSVCQVP
jgi:hypothetical protein